jgi:hypothetical protein
MRGLSNQFQSGARPGETATTALLKITDDISVNLDRKFLTTRLKLGKNKIEFSYVVIDIS